MRKFINKIQLLIIFILVSFISYGDKNFIFIEGEDAIVTNFNNEPTFNFRCSNILALQLNRKTEIEGELKFFSEYVFYVEEDGEYVLWIAGTPPGSASQAFPSYFSPYIIQIDDNTPVTFYFEDVVVTERYTSGFYWTKLSKIKLTKGKHKIRFQVKQRRGYDNYYYCYIDAFFFIKVNKYGEYIYPETLPPFFPKDINSKKRIILRTPEDYLSLLKNDPLNKELLESIAEVYSLTYQYTDAIKYLKTLSLLEPDNLEYQRLIAQNYLWKGDFTSGINLFKEILKKNPENLFLYREIAKIIAWSGLYKNAIEIYLDGLKRFKDDLDLQINLALTYYWNSEKEKGDAILESIKRKGNKDPKILLEAALILKKNRYFDLATSFLEIAVNLKSKDPLVYTTLAQIYFESGNITASDKVLNEMRSIYQNEDDYQKEIGNFKSKVELKNEFANFLEEKLKEKPFDTETRQILSEFYAWYNKNEKALEHYKKILEIQLYKKIENFEDENINLSNFLLLFNIYFSYLIKEKDQYLKNVKDIENSLQEAKKTSDKSKIESILKELEKKVILAEKQYELFNYFIKFYEEKNTELIKILSRKKEYLDLFNKEKEKLNFTFNYQDFKKNYTDIYKKEKDYLSLKILTTVSYYLSVQDYENFITTLINNFSNIEKVKYQQIVSLIEKGRLDDSLNFIKENLLILAPINPTIQDIRDELTKIKNSSIVKDEEVALLPLSIELLQERIGFLVKNSIEIVKQLDEKLQRTKKAVIDIKSVYNLDIIKTFFDYEKESVHLRAELGNFYAKIRKYKEAEEQFKRVLSVLPDEMSIKNMLANVYLLRENWYKAMKLYKEVFTSDPKNTLAASLYNNIINSHPLTFSSKTKYTTEGSLINNVDAKIFDYTQSLNVVTETINTHILLNRVLSLDFSLDYMSRTRRNSIGYIDYSYRDDLVASFPIILRYNNFTFKSSMGFDIPNTGIKLAITGGLDWFNTINLEIFKNSFKEKYFKTEEHEENFLDRHVLYPYFGAKILWNYIQYFNFYLDYYYQLNKECIIPYTRGFYFHKNYYIKTDRRNANTFMAEHVFNLSLNYNLSFINLYPFTNIYFNTAGEFVAYTISDITQKQLSLPFEYSITQAINFKFLELKKSGYSMDLILIFLYEGSLKDFDKNIKNVFEINKNDLSNKKDYFLTMYLPHQIFYIKSGLNFEYNFDNLTNIPLTLWSKAIFAPVWRHLFTPLDDSLYHTDPRNYNRKTPFFYMNILSGVELNFKKFNLNFDFDYALTYDVQLAGTKKSENYQTVNSSLYITVPIHNNIMY